MISTFHAQAKRRLIATITSLLVVAGVIVVADHAKKPATMAGSTTDTQPPNGSSSSSGGTTVTATSFKDGTYTASSSYSVPPGTQSIQVKLTLSGGVITDVSVQNSEGDPTSARFQEEFASSYKSQVVGQKLSGFQLDAVAGASDTTEGFNQALSQIVSEAHA